MATVAEQLNALPTHTRERLKYPVHLLRRNFIVAVPFSENGEIARQAGSTDVFCSLSLTRHNSPEYLNGVLEEIFISYLVRRCLHQFFLYRRWRPTNHRSAVLLHSVLTTPPSPQSARQFLRYENNAHAFNTLRRDIDSYLWRYAAAYWFSRTSIEARVRSRVQN